MRRVGLGRTLRVLGRRRRSLELAEEEGQRMGPREGKMCMNAGSLGYLGRQRQKFLDLEGGERGYAQHHKCCEADD